MTDDEKSVISVAMTGTGKRPSEGRLNQLDAARKNAILSRKVKQRSRLEAKLRELRQLMDEGGESSMNYEQLTRITTKLLAQEETLREKQNLITLACNENLETIQESLANLTKMTERIYSAAIRSPPPHNSTSYAGSSVGSNAGSVTSLHTSTHHARRSPPRTQQHR